MKILNELEKYKIIAIARKLPMDKVLPTAKALLDGGIKFIEVTFDQKNINCINETTAAIRLLRNEFGNEMFIGAGTVLGVLQAEAAVKAGAEYLLSPNFNEAVVRRTVELGAVSIPGAFTPTEITAAYETGAHIVKLFPAGELGLGYIKAVLAPLCHIPMLGVGGIDENNIASFLKIGLKGVGIGSNILKNEFIEQENYKEITALSKKYTDKIFF